MELSLTLVEDRWPSRWRKGRSWKEQDGRAGRASPEHATLGREVAGEGQADLMSLSSAYTLLVRAGGTGGRLGALENRESAGKRKKTYGAQGTGKSVAWLGGQ